MNLEEARLSVAWRGGAIAPRYWIGSIRWARSPGRLVNPARQVSLAAEWQVDFEYEGGDEGSVSAYPIVHSIGDGLSCNACGLTLVGFDELKAAGIDPVTIFEDVESSEVGEP